MRAFLNNIPGLRDPSRTALWRRSSTAANPSPEALPGVHRMTGWGMLGLLQAALLMPGQLAAQSPAGPSLAGKLLPSGPPAASRGGQSGNQVTRIAVDRALGAAPALSSFRLLFMNGDHHPPEAMIMPADTAFQAALADSGGEDEFSAHAEWWVVPGATGGVVEGLVSGVAELEVPAGPPNSTLVLSGFDFKRRDGSDANLRTVAVQLDSATRKVRTALLDDQGADFSTLATAVAVGFAFGAFSPDPGGTMGAVFATGSTVGALDAAAGVERAANARMRSYTVRIAYAWVPNRYVEAVREVSGSRRQVGAVSGRLPRLGEYVLTGFSFHFGNSDHFLRTIGVHLSGVIPMLPGNTGVAVSWQDANQDDPIQWNVRFAPLRLDGGAAPIPAPVRPLQVPLKRP